MKNNFTVKLSKHKHADELCIRTVTFDDNWKIARSKCYYNQMTLKTEELESNTTWVYPNTQPAEFLLSESQKL